jgi:rod shape determining protein RodA
MKHKFKKLDWVIVGIVFVFMIASFFLVRSAIQNQGDSYAGYEYKHLKFFIAGFVVMILVAFAHYHILLRYAVHAYIVGNLALIAVFLFGPEVNGAKGWFQLGGFMIQPAELVKLVLIIVLAFVLARKDGEELDFSRDVMQIGLIAFVPFALVMIQPDLGNAIIYLVILLGMLWIGNVRYRVVVIATTSILLIGFLGLLVYQMNHTWIANHVPHHWVSRIDTFMNPENAPANDVYQVMNASVAIGSGGLFGSGYMHGDSTKNGFIPYPYSDSIFVVVGEEFGFFGASVLLLLYFFLLYRMILIAMQCRDVAGTYIVVGIVSMFIFQIFENVGMMMGIMPLTGITLPFISYGGSSLLINMAALGVVLSIHANPDLEEEVPY